ncbi:acyl-CoA synthetase [Pseudomonas poae]|uniref:Acyl-CoA synthetase n=2 Tax=Pseudomonas poae TaxID=200451 RepID=A0A423ESV0_9PSED|nr:acyl-CoA synthetase [Pseudomonas poae]
MHGLGDVLREHQRSRPHLVAAVDGSVRLTWPELNQRVNRLSNVLREQGVGQGGRVLWLGQNSFRLLETTLAAAKLGAIFCPANWRLSAAEVAHILEDFKPAVVIWQQAEVGEQLAAVRAQFGQACKWIQHDAVAELGYEQLLAAADDHDNELRVSSDAPVLALYTAAFDGKPNAALLSHAALISQSLLLAYSQSISQASVFLNSGPLFHLGTLMSTLATFLFGGLNVFVARVEPEELLRNIAAERVTHAFIAKPTLDQIRELNADGRYDVSSIWASPQASEWNSPVVIPTTAPFNNVPTVYGQTELMGFAVMGWLGDGQGAGRPSPLAQVKIVDEAGDELPVGETGEIAVRGLQVMNGYCDRDLENQRRTRDGWYRTNDLGKRLEDGSIAFVGPKATMIKSGVENIYPAEIEGCLRSLTGVKDVCVIGVPDPVWTQNVKALVALAEGTQLSEQQVIEHCRTHLASYKKPKLVTFVTTLPRRADGMLDRAAADLAYGGGGYPSAG